MKTARAVASAGADSLEEALDKVRIIIATATATATATTTTTATATVTVVPWP
jgi:hypothetical protein